MKVFHIDKKQKRISQHELLDAYARLVEEERLVQEQIEQAKARHAKALSDDKATNLSKRNF